ncbi:DUF2235 domain-containing protein, partial [Candidatus Calescamantes bacterium]|nr:DUF2235 domain-containing protein [Candidatus Calescamantes bacterium]
VICSDGTWNTPDQKQEGKYNPTNVVKMARAIAPVSEDGKHQVVFYDWGIGADQWGLDRLTGGAFGNGLDKNIEDAYRFLMHNYEEGDEIFLFGFSRGAYTVRSLVGLIRNSGLLKKIHADKFEEAYKLYRDEEEPDSPKIKKFRKKYSREIEIEFIGVWDTVGALGIPVSGFRWLRKWLNKRIRWLKKRYEFHDTELSHIVKNAFHALAIDEKREPFKPTLWKDKPKEGQRVEQVWFAGVHGDVGGGYKDSKLGDVAFMWMKEKAQECGLAFNREYIKEVIHPDPMGRLHNSFVGFFKLLGEYLRPIGKTSTEKLHPSVIERYKKYKPPYKPQNLVEYLNRPGFKIA